MDFDDIQSVDKYAEEVEKGIFDNRDARKGACKQCLVCCYRMLCRYSLNVSAFSNLFLTKEYIRTLENF